MPNRNSLTADEKQERKVIVKNQTVLKEVAYFAAKDLAHTLSFLVFATFLFALIVWVSAKQILKFVFVGNVTRNKRN